MKPALEHLPAEKDQSFVVKFFDYRYYPTPWHYHPELEIVYVMKSTGKRFIGDHISDFAPGNLALLGPNIPHLYKNDDYYYQQGSRMRAQSIVIHFTRESLGNDFLDLPESRLLNQLFEKSQYGLDISGKTNKLIARKLQDIVHLSGMKRWICLVDILNEIAASRSVSYITDIPQAGFNEKESTRLCKVFEWATNNFDKDIRLSEAAAIAKMNENAFSRFFSQRTRKTFFEFIKELRLRKAAKLLAEENMTVTEICYDCGYSNISNFNRQFLQHYQMNPLKYRKSFQDK